jgi:hypothetical protein
MLYRVYDIPHRSVLEVLKILAQSRGEGKSHDPDWAAASICEFSIGEIASLVQRCSVEQVLFHCPGVEGTQEVLDLTTGIAALLQIAL